MKWTDDVAPAVAGDDDARARLSEFLEPFVHGVLLAHAPHHLANRALPKLLESVLESLDGVPVESLGPRALALARRHGQKLASMGEGELHARRHDVSLARQHLGRLRVLLESTRERLVLRLVEGLSGPEIASVSGVREHEVRADLELGASEALRLLGLPPGPVGYVWNFEGTPPSALARLETQLTALRYDPDEVVQLPFESGSGSTWQDLSQVGARAGALDVADTSSPTATALIPSERDEQTHAGGPELRPQGLAPALAPPKSAVAGPTIQTVDFPVAALPPGFSADAPDAGPDDVREVTNSAETALLPEPKEAVVTAEAPLSGELAEPPGDTAPLVRSSESFEGTPTDPPLRTNLLDDEQTVRPEKKRAHTERAVRTFAARPEWRRWALPAAAVALVLVVAGLWVAKALVAPPPGVDVLVAGRELAEGEALGTDDFASSKLLPGAVTAELLRPADAAGLVGTRVPVPLQLGDPVLAGLSHAVPVRARGRLKAVRLFAPSSLEVRSGDRVDVHVTRPSPGTGKLLVVVAAADVPVLVTPLEGGARKGRSPTLALLLEPKAAARVELAQRVGRLELVTAASGAAPSEVGTGDFLAQAEAKEQLAQRRASVRLIRAQR